MTLEEAIHDKLTTTPAVSALVGTRIYPEEAPQDADLPFVVYQEAARQTVMTMSGPVDLDSWRMSLELYADRRSSLRSLSAAIRTAMNGYKGDIGSGTIRVCGVFIEDETSELSPPQHAEDRGVMQCNMDLAIWYKPI